MSKIEDTHTDVLQNIEFAIVTQYRQDPDMIDIDAADAVDALVRHYAAEEDGRRPPVPRLADRAARVFDAVKEACEWRLGRGSVADIPPAVIPIEKMVKCLRRIQKSIRLWHSEGGRRGYLDFVKQYVF